MDERRHMPSGVGPGVFATMCGIQGDYMVVAWAYVTCEDCVNTLPIEKQKALGSYKERVSNGER